MPILTNCITLQRRKMSFEDVQNSFFSEPFAKDREFWWSLGMVSIVLIVAPHAFRSFLTLLNQQLGLFHKEQCTIFSYIQNGYLMKTIIKASGTKKVTQSLWRKWCFPP
jgi:hypothetical protein